MTTRRARLTRCLKHVESTGDVYVSVEYGVFHRNPHTGIGGEMNDVIAPPLDGTLDSIRVAYIVLDDIDQTAAVMSNDVLQIFNRANGHVVYYPDLIRRKAIENPRGQSRPDKSTATSDKPRAHINSTIQNEPTSTLRRRFAGRLHSPSKIAALTLAASDMRLWIVCTHASCHAVGEGGQNPTGTASHIQHYSLTMSSVLPNPHAG